MDPKGKWMEYILLTQIVSFWGSSDGFFWFLILNVFLGLEDKLFIFNIVLFLRKMAGSLEQNVFVSLFVFWSSFCPDFLIQLVTRKKKTVTGNQRQPRSSSSWRLHCVMKIQAKENADFYVVFVDWLWKMNKLCKVLVPEATCTYLMLFLKWGSLLINRIRSDRLQNRTVDAGETVIGWFDKSASLRIWTKKNKTKQDKSQIYEETSLCRISVGSFGGRVCNIFFPFSTISGVGSIVILRIITLYIFYTHTMRLVYSPTLILFFSGFSWR